MFTNIIMVEKVDFCFLYSFSKLMSLIHFLFFDSDNVPVHCFIGTTGKSVVEEGFLLYFFQLVQNIQLMLFQMKRKKRCK